MYIYNVTIKVIPEIETAWIQWMKEEHMAEVVATGCFHSSQFLELLDPIDEEGKTFVAQYFTEDAALYSKYIEEHAPSLRAKGYDRFGNGFIAFRSILKIL